MSLPRFLKLTDGLGRAAYVRADAVMEIIVPLGAPTFGSTVSIYGRIVSFKETPEEIIKKLEVDVV